MKFDHDKRDSIDKRNVPGPGSYEYENAVFKYGSKQDPSYGFGAKLEPTAREYSLVDLVMCQDLEITSQKATVIQGLEGLLVER